MAARPEPFELHVSDADLADLKSRLQRTRFPDVIQDLGDGWEYGMEAGLHKLLLFLNSGLSIKRRIW